MPEITYKPGPGIRVIKHKGKKLTIIHKEGKTMILGEERQPITPQYIDIICYGTDGDVIKDFIETAIDHCMNRDAETIDILEVHPWGLGWL